MEFSRRDIMKKIKKLKQFRRFTYKRISGNFCNGGIFVIFLEPHENHDAAGNFHLPEVTEIDCFDLDMYEWTPDQVRIDRDTWRPL